MNSTSPDLVAVGALGRIAVAPSPIACRKRARRARNVSAFPLRLIIRLRHGGSVRASGHTSSLVRLRERFGEGSAPFRWSAASAFVDIRLNLTPNPFPEKEGEPERRDYGSPAAGTSTSVISMRPVGFWRQVAGSDDSAVSTNSVRPVGPPSMHA